MNLDDLIDPDFGFVEDTLTGLVFGETGQLQIVGWSGKHGTVKLHILHCSTCSKDPELFGEGYFKTTKSGLNKGLMPCGCSNIPKWSQTQTEVICGRKCKELGIKFVGFIGEYKGAKTPCNLFCPEHGEYSVTKISYFVNRGQKGCKLCKAADAAKRFRKPDETMIASFFKSGVFHPDTKFTRSERKLSNGYPAFWNVYCPVCEQEVDSYCGSLQSGCLPCECKGTRQTRAYITGIYDKDTIIALKFGVAQNPNRRIKEQQPHTIYELKHLGVWEFPKEAMCLAAERECKNSLVCSVVPKEELKDGYTETSYISNLENIISIYEDFGGTRISLQ